MVRNSGWRAVVGGLVCAMLIALIFLGHAVARADETAEAEPAAAQESSSGPETAKEPDSPPALEEPDRPEKTAAPTGTPAPASDDASPPEDTSASGATQEPVEAKGSEETPPPADTPGPEATPEPGAQTQEDTSAPTQEPTPEPTPGSTPAPESWTIGKEGLVKEKKAVMRAEPRKDASKVLTKSRGDQVSVLSGIRDDGGAVWLLVKSGKKKGYVPEADIVLCSEADDGSGLIKTKNTRARRLNWTGVVNASGGGMAIPQLYQFNFRTVLCYYGGVPRSVSRSGCNVTCISMVVAYLTGNKNQTPETMFDWAVDHDQYFGDGLGHEQMSRVASHWGVDSRWIANDEKRITEALKQGYPVIAHMGEGLFTSEGHYIVLRGVTKNGKILVNDPNSKGNSGKAFPLSTILREARRADSSFMVCYPPSGTQES